MRLFIDAVAEKNRLCWTADPDDEASAALIRDAEERAAECAEELKRRTRDFFRPPDPPAAGGAPTINSSPTDSSSIVPAAEAREEGRWRDVTCAECKTGNSVPASAQAPWYCGHCQAELPEPSPALPSAGEEEEARRFAHVSTDGLIEALRYAKQYTATACHWALDTAISRLRAAEQGRAEVEREVREAVGALEGIAASTYTGGPFYATERLQRTIDKLRALTRTPDPKPEGGPSNG